jgi:superfamily II DNA/RNA helicase
MRFAVSAIWCRIRNCYRLHVACDMVLRFAVQFDAQFLVVKDRHGRGIAHQIADTLNCICNLVHTQNRICSLVQKKKIGSDSDTLNRICDLVHTPNRICDLQQNARTKSLV